MITAITLATLFAAALVHATLGFGIALVAMPVLTVLLGVRTAAPLVVFVMIAEIAVILWRDRQLVDIAAASQLLIASIAGLPIGLYMLNSVDTEAVETLLGAVLVFFCLYNLLHPRLVTLRGWAWGYVFGFLAGVLGGAFNANGPPVVIYGALRRWSPQHFRATLQAFFLPADIMICVGHGLAGMWTMEILRLFSLSIPLIGLAIVIGQKLMYRIPHESFERLLYMVSLLVGVLLIL